MYGDMNAIMTQRAHKSSTPLIGKAQGSSKGIQGNLGRLHLSKAHGPGSRNKH